MKKKTRIVGKMPKNANTAGIFKELKILKLSDVVKLELLKLGYKLTNDILPTPLKDMFDKSKGK